MRGDAELSGLVSSFIRNFWFGYRNRLNAAPMRRISAAILDLLGSAFASRPDAQAVYPATSPVWRVRIKDYVEAHLHEPDLTPTQIARALRISKRHLHSLFDEGDETIARHIQRRRLEECAETLADPSERGRTVTELALSYGFNNSSHFSRVFRARYKTTPRDYRATARL